MDHSPDCGWCLSTLPPHLPNPTGTNKSCQAVLAGWQNWTQMSLSWGQFNSGYDSHLWGNQCHREKRLKGAPGASVPAVWGMVGGGVVAPASSSSWGRLWSALSFAVLWVDCVYKSGMESRIKDSSPLYMGLGSPVHCPEQELTMYLWNEWAERWINPSMISGAAIEPASRSPTFLSGPVPQLFLCHYFFMPKF